MVSTRTTQKMRSRAERKLYDFDPGVTSLTDVGWVSAAHVTGMLVGFFRTIGTGATVLHILGNTAADGSGTDVTIKTKTVSAEPDAVGDYIWEEISADEIAAAAADAGVEILGLSAQVSLATGTDEAVIYYELEKTYQQDQLTADVVA